MLVFYKKTHIHNANLSLSLNFAFIFYKNRMEIKLGRVYGDDYIGECQYQTNLILDGVKKVMEKEHNLSLIHI